MSLSSNISVNDTLQVLDCPEIFREFQIRYMFECGHDHIWNSALFQRTEFADAVACSSSRVGSIPVKTSNFDIDTFLCADATAGDVCPPTGEQSEVLMLTRKMQKNRRYSADSFLSFYQNCDEEDELLAFFESKSGPDWMQYYGVLSLVALIAIYKNLAANAPFAAGTILDAVANPVSGTSDLNQMTFNAADNLVSCSIVDSVIMHQAVATQMMNQALLQCPCIDDEGSRLYNLNDGRPVTVVIDSLGKTLLEGGASATIGGTLQGLGFDGAAGTYLTIMYRRGLMHYGEGQAKRPIEIDSNPCAQNGSGEESIYERRVFVLHPEGFSFIADANGSFAANDDRSPDITDYGNPAFWEPVFPVERLPVKFLVTNI